VSDNYDEVAGTSHPIRLPPSKKDIGFLSMVLQKPKDAVIALGIDPHASIKDEDGPERRKAGLFAEYWMKEEEAEKIVEAVLSDLGKSREEITSYIEANKSK